MENAPLLSAVAVPKEEEPLKRVTVEPASAVPEIIGVESFVKDEDVDKDVGASGTVASTVIDKAEEAEDVFPAESAAVAVSE